MWVKVKPVVSPKKEKAFYCSLSICIDWFHLKWFCSKLMSTVSPTIKLMSPALTILGVILRDSHGVAQVRFVTGNKILRILKSKGLAPDLPEDLYHLIKKAVAVRKHLERNRKVM